MSLSASSRSQALRGVPGAISSAMEAIKAGRQIIVAEDNAAEVGLIEGHECLVAGHLQEVCVSRGTPCAQSFHTGGRAS
jgi:predicted ATPase with chaperone activity